MKKRMNRRALSDVVATVLIILLVLAAIGVIWVFVRGNLEGAGESISKGGLCLENEVKPVTCVGDAFGNYNIGYSRDTNDEVTGFGDNGIRINVEYEDGSAGSFVATNQPDDSASENQLLSSVEVEGKVIKKVKLVSEFTLEDGQEASCESIEIRCNVIQGETSLIAEDVRNGLISEWKFEDGPWDGTSGEVIDNAGNSNADARDQTGSSIADRVVETVTGLNGNAADFRYSSLAEDDARFITPGVVPGTNGDGDFTWSVLVNPDDVEQYSSSGLVERAVMGIQDSPSLYTRLGSGVGSGIPGDSSGQWGIRWGSDKLRALEFLEDDKWVNLVVVREGDDLKLYRDGDLKVTHNVAGKSSPGTSFTIGHLGFSPGNNRANFFNSMDGLIDEVRIYSRALSDEEVEQLNDFMTQ